MIVSFIDYDFVYTIEVRNPLYKYNRKADQHRSWQWKMVHTFAVCQKARTASFFAPARGNTGEARLYTGKSKCGAYCSSCGLAGVRIAADTPSCARLFSDSVFRLGVFSLC